VQSGALWGIFCRFLGPCAHIWAIPSSIIPDETNRLGKHDLMPIFSRSAVLCLPGLRGSSSVVRDVRARAARLPGVQARCPYSCEKHVAQWRGHCNVEASGLHPIPSWLDQQVIPSRSQPYPDVVGGDPKCRRQQFPVFCLTLRMHHSRQLA